MNINFVRAGSGFVLPARDGQSVSYSTPAGCVLRRQYGDEWETVIALSPFVHSGATASYRIDCDAFTVPVTATLTIA